MRTSGEKQAFAWMVAVVLAIVPYGDAVVPGQLLDSNLLTGEETPDVDLTIFVWPPEASGGTAHFTVHSNFAQGTFFVVPNWEILLWTIDFNTDGTARAPPITSDDISMVTWQRGDLPTDPHTIVTDHFDVFFNDIILELNLTDDQYFKVISSYNLAGFVIGQDSIGDIFGTSPVESDATSIFAHAGNRDTAVSGPTADYNSLVINDMAEYILGHFYWWAGHGFHTSPLPGADLGYYIQIATDGQVYPELVNIDDPGDPILEPTPDLYTIVNVYCGVASEVLVATVTVQGMLQPELVYIPTNEPCRLESYVPAPNHDQKIMVMVYKASGQAGVNSPSTAPSMHILVPAVFWYFIYQVTIPPLPAGLQADITVVVYDGTQDETYAMAENPSNWLTTSGKVTDTPGDWAQIATGTFRTITVAVGDSDTYQVFVNMEMMRLGVYLSYRCTTPGEYCATASWMDIGGTANAFVPELTTLAPGASTSAGPTTPASTTSAAAPTPAPTTSAAAPTPAPTTSAATPTPGPTTTATPAPTLTPAPTPAPTVSPSPTPTTPTTPTRPITPTTPTIPGCPCLRIFGFELEDPRYSELNGVWIQQDDLYNDLPYYKHMGCQYYLYMLDGPVRYWVVGPVLGDTRGVLVNFDIYNLPSDLDEPWRVYDFVSMTWRNAGSISVSCGCDGVVPCISLLVTSSSALFPGLFTFSGIHDGHAYYRNDVTGLFMYYNMEPGNCYRWVIAADIGLVSTRGYVYDTAFWPTDVTSTWKVRNGFPDNVRYDMVTDVNVVCA